MSAGSGPRASMRSATSRATAGATTRAVFPAERALLAGMRVEPGDGEARPGDAEPLRARSRATIRPVSTIRSLSSCPGTSLSGRWMVTGTTASSGDHSIMTGRAVTPVISATSRARNSVWPGSAKPGAVEHALGDRIGDHRARRAGDHVGDRAPDRRDRGRRARCVRPAGFGRDRDGRSERPEARPQRPRRRHRRLDDLDRDVEPEPRRAACQEVRIGQHIERGERQLARRRQAISVMSGPMPAGSPSVSARGRGRPTLIDIRSSRRRAVP